MAHVSKHPLKKDLSHKLFAQLAKTVARSSKRSTAVFLGTLLTETEQLMLAKRLAVMLMLHEGYSPYKISRILKMSTSTTTLMQEQYTNGSYNEILGIMGKSKAEKEEFWRLLEKILRAGMPSMGKDRWQYLKSMK